MQARKLKSKSVLVAAGILATVAAGAVTAGSSAAQDPPPPIVVTPLTPRNVVTDKVSVKYTIKLDGQRKQVVHSGDPLAARRGRDHGAAGGEVSVALPPRPGGRERRRGGADLRDGARLQAPPVPGRHVVRRSREHDPLGVQLQRWRNRVDRDVPRRARNWSADDHRRGRGAQEVRHLNQRRPSGPPAGWRDGGTDGASAGSRSLARRQPTRDLGGRGDDHADDAGVVFLRQRERRTRHGHSRRAGSGRVEHRGGDRRHAGRRLLDADRVADPTHFGQGAFERRAGPDGPRSEAARARPARTASTWARSPNASRHLPADDPWAGRRRPSRADTAIMPGLSKRST